MNYKENFTTGELNTFEEIIDWEAYYKEQLLLNPFKIQISRKIFRSEVAFTGIYNIDISFEKCYFEKSIYLGPCTFNRSLSIYNSYCEESFSALLDEIKFEKDFTILAFQVKNFLVSNGDYNNCTWVLSGCDLCSITGGDFRNLYLSIWDTGMSEFRLYTTHLSGNVNIDGGYHKVQKVNLAGHSKNVNISISDIDLNQLIIENYRNEGVFRLINISTESEKSEFIVMNSYMGKAEFNSIDFSDFNLVLIEGTHIVDCAFNNVVWPKKLHGAKIDLPEVNKITNQNRFNLRSRETFRQLKYAMYKQGDIINEQKFHSLEMLAFDKGLKWEDNFWTKIIIKLSYLTSDFGQSFWRPLFFIFIFHTVFFLSLLLSGFFPYIMISVHGPSLMAFMDGLNTYLFLMNPLRKPDQEAFHGGWIGIDILMRISSSYMIYNMIRATRRFIK